MTSEPSESNPAARQTAFLVIQNQVFPLNRDVILIGRRLTNHLVIDDRRVSRMHAQIRLVNKQYFVVDMNSTGGTFVNGTKVMQAILYPGDQISLAGVLINFVQDSVEFENKAEDYTFPNIPIDKQAQITKPKEQNTK